MAEDEESAVEIGWPTFAEDQGFARGENVVTVQSVVAITSPMYSAGDRPVDHVQQWAEIMGGSFTYWAHTAFKTGVWNPLVVVGPSVAKVIASQWTKDEVRRYLYDHMFVTAERATHYARMTTTPTFNLQRLVELGILPPDYAESNDPAREVHVIIRPDTVGLLVAGDPGRNQSRAYMSNHIQGPPTSRRVELPARLGGAAGGEARLRLRKVQASWECDLAVDDQAALAPRVLVTRRPRLGRFRGTLSMADLAALPSVDRLLRTEPLLRAQRTHGREQRDAGGARATRGACVKVWARTARWRRRARRSQRSKRSRTTSRWHSTVAARPSLRRVLNLTGTVLHTNLGRAVLPESAVAALADAARNPCNLEYDLDDGGRGERDEHVERLVVALTGAEAALVVNNNAAAVFLVLNTLAQRREVIVSRGELVEIGGQFRIPDVMTRAGARLREVGATNRTHLGDYADADRTAYGAAAQGAYQQLRGEGIHERGRHRVAAALARERAVPLAVDLGSGTLLDMRQWGLPEEPTVRATLAAGADLVMFSGDKLLGGPQCGIVAGRRDLVAPLRRNPLKRALRVDKLVIAALEQVLRLYLHVERLPRSCRRYGGWCGRAARSSRSRERSPMRCAPRCRRRSKSTLWTACSQIGSGALPVDRLASSGVRITSRAARRQRDRDVQKLHARAAKLAGAHHRPHRGPRVAARLSLPGRARAGSGVAARYRRRADRRRFRTAR